MTMFYQIGEVCQRTGLTQRALHYYDEIGLLVPSERLNGGQRLYAAADLERIGRIKNLKQLLGLSLGEIKRLLDADEARAKYLSAAQTASDPARRRKAVEDALQVTADQLQSVREKVHQLGRLQRQLERQVRELRRVTTPAGPSRAPAAIGDRP
ncbi:MAG TPA: MerR family transcriptional regulator [bacterium]|nr:MerR family transcriptional regulator [bacterium]